MFITGHIPVRKRGGKVIAWAIVDGEDLNRLKSYRWWLHDYGYAVRTFGPRGAQKRGRMHREALRLDAGDGRVVDHINRNPLDNRKGNLRLGTQRENCQNQGSRGGTSRYRGVSFDKWSGRWVARIMVNRRQYNVGRFDTEEEAAQAASDFRAKHMPFSEDARAA